MFQGEHQGLTSKQQLIEKSCTKNFYSWGRWPGHCPQEQKFFVLLFFKKVTAFSSSLPLQRCLLGHAVPVSQSLRNMLLLDVLLTVQIRDAAGDAQ